MRSRLKALHPSPVDAGAHLAQGHEPAVLAARGAADLDDADGELEVEVVDGAAQQLRPDGPARGRAAAVAARQWVHADDGAHAGELGAEAWA